MDKKNLSQKTKKLQIIVAIITIVFVGIIFTLKYTAKKPAPIHTDTDSITTNTAIPDTTISPTDAPEIELPKHKEEPDTLEQDTRAPKTAGYEDGYDSGLDDGLLGYKYSYDESSQYKKANDRKQYAEGYAEGYAKGYAAQKEDTPAENGKPEENKNETH